MSLHSYFPLRSSIVTWTFQLLDQYNLGWEIGTIAMSYIDRFMVARQGLASSDVMGVNLAALCSLQLAVKLHAPNSPNKSKILLALLNSELSTEMILKGELELLRTLSWKLHQPTAKSFIVQLMELINQKLPGLASHISTKDIVNVASYFAKHAVYSYNLATTKPSLVAFASLFNAIDHLSSIGGSKTYECYHVPLQDLMSLFPSLLVSDPDQLDSTRCLLWKFARLQGGRVAKSPPGLNFKKRSGASFPRVQDGRVVKSPPSININKISRAA